MSIIYNEQLQTYIDTDVIDQDEELEMVKEQAKPTDYVFRSESGKIYVF